MFSVCPSKQKQQQKLSKHMSTMSMQNLEGLCEYSQIMSLSSKRKARLRKLPHSAIQLSRTMQEGDLVLIKIHTASPFEPKYSSPSRVLGVCGNQIELVPATGGRTRMEHRKHVKYILPAERVISELPEYGKFGRKSKLRLDPAAIPDIKWEWMEDRHTGSIGMTSEVKHMH